MRKVRKIMEVKEKHRIETSRLLGNFHIDFNHFTYWNSQVWQTVRSEDQSDFTEMQEQTYHGFIRKKNFFLDIK